ncbi:Fanconi anemia core complex-associated protein 24-like isoform X2 [Corticium candelabrum]|uniref:Fanconi anemia core complex-associated protein 24-like isoform X2 n=1 Tax=Corticium candelabrum TaxID=121492 RepID=UPI002E2711C7|nr:Fanconi anemia core complex-associated protein 24-like isoform X2 [Corticium candelabrum]
MSSARPACSQAVGTKLPAGCVFVNERIRQSEVVRKLQNGLNVSIQDSMGSIDFFTSNSTAVILLSESEVVDKQQYQSRLMKLAQKQNKYRGVALVEKTSLTEQYYGALQKFGVIDCNLVILPVSNATEAAQQLTAMVYQDEHPANNPYRRRHKARPLDSSLLETVQLLPGIGIVKAKALLNRFKTV